MLIKKIKARKRAIIAVIERDKIIRSTSLMAIGNIGRPNKEVDRRVGSDG